MGTCASDWKRWKRGTSSPGSCPAPEVASDPARLRDLGKQHRELEEVVSVYRQYRKALSDAEEARALAKDEQDGETREYFRQEAGQAAAEARELEGRLEILLLPKDPNDEKNVIVEIRAGAGGQEAALFAADLLGMYRRYAEAQAGRRRSCRPAFGPRGIQRGRGGGPGDGAYSRLKRESGVHRVQRIPETESGGRIHTSAYLQWPSCPRRRRSRWPYPRRTWTSRCSGPRGRAASR